MKIQSNLKVNALLNTIKQLCSIIFPLITFPYASRILGSYYYGRISFSASIISYMSMIAGLGISKYAIREGSKKRDDNRKLNTFCNQIYTINIISTAVSFGVLIFLILFVDKVRDYQYLLMVQYLQVIFQTLGTDWINSIHEDYKYITKRYIVCQSISIAMLFLFVKDENDYLIYAFISNLGNILANISNMFYIRHHYKIWPKLVRDIDRKTNLKPIMFFFFISLASKIYINSDITILGIFCSDNEVGLYSASSKIYDAVKELLIAMLTVSIPRIAHDFTALTKEKFNHELGEILGTLLVLAVPCSVGLFQISKNVILLLSGEEFLGAYSSLMILSLAIIFATVACFYINVVIVPIGLENKALIATIVSAMANIVLNFIFIPEYGQDAAAATTLISEIIMSVMGYLYARPYIQLKIGRHIVTSIVEGVAVFIACSLIARFQLGNLMTIVCSIVLSAVACLLIVMLLDGEALRALTIKGKKHR